MIKLFVAGSSGFVERIRRDADQNPSIRIVFMAADPSSAVDVIERNVQDCHGILFGFNEDQNKALLEIAFRYGTSMIPFISVNDMLTGFKTWTPYKARPVMAGQELTSIAQQLKDISKPEEEYRFIAEDTEARVEAVRDRAITNAIGVQRKTVSVFSFKGGVGKTTLVVALARSVAALTTLKTCIIDLDVSRNYGDVIRYLEYVGDKKKQIKSTVVNWKEFDYNYKSSWEKVEPWLFQVHPRLYVLPGIKDMNDNADLTPEIIENVADTLRRHFDLVLFDLGNHLTNQALIAMEASDDVFFVDTLDMPEIDSLQEFLDYVLPQLHVKRSNINVIFNRIIPGLEHKPEDASYYIKTPCLASIPEDIAVRLSIANQSRVPYLGGQDIPFTRELEKILVKIFPREVFGFRKANKGGFLECLKRIFK